jgi:uncharacterized protein YdcH (DUF465 family)
MSDATPQTGLAVANAATASTLFKKNITTEVQSVVLPLTAIKPIASADDKLKAEEALKAAKKTRKTVENIRKESTKILDDAKDSLMNREKEFAKQLDDEIKRVETDINRWNNAELVRVRNEQAQVQAQALKDAKRLRNEGSIANHEIKTQAKVQEVAKTAPTGISTQWVFKGVIDQSKVPAEYLSVDPAKVNAAIKQGVKSIPGLDIKEEAKRTGK